ncbi:hypothetical protein SLA2020_410680 [Shorea laevis]
MAAISEFFSHLYTITLVLFTILILELVMLVQSVTGFHSRKPKINSTQYLKFIEEKNPTIRYSRRSKLEPNECIVCLSEIEEGEKVRRLKCNHTFHRDCLDEWLQQFWATCPLCRTKVLPDEIVANFRSQNEVYDGSDEDIMHMLTALHSNSIHRFF